MGLIMGRLFTVLLVLFAPFAWGNTLSSELICELPNQKNIPFLKLGLSSFAFENQIQKILDSQVSSIQESVMAINLQDMSIGESRGPCPKYKSTPGFDNESLCLYVPKVLLGEAISIRNFKDELKKSVGLRLNFDNIQIPEFELTDPKIQCEFNDGSAECKIEVKMPKLIVESQFDFLDPRENKKRFSTVSPLKLTIEAKDELMPTITMMAKLQGSGKANEAIEIVQDSMKFNVPASTLSTQIQNSQEDIMPRVEELLEYEVDPNLSEDDKTRALLALLESERGNEILETVAASFGFIELAKAFLGDTDVLANFQEPLLERIEEPLSIILSDVIEGVLPFDKSLEFAIPIAPTQDQMDAGRYLERFQEITDYLDRAEEVFVNLDSYGKAREVRRIHSKEVKKIGKFTERIRHTQLEEISEELVLLEIQLGAHIQTLEATGLVSKSLRKRLTQAHERVNAAAQMVSNSTLPTYRKSLLQIDSIGHVSKEGLSILVSGCHVGGRTPNATENWHLGKPILPAHKDNDFSLEIPVSVVNQHLALLHENGFYDYCQGRRGKSCAEYRGPGRTSFKIKRAPRIKMHKQKYVFEMPEVQRTSYTILPNFLDRAFFRDSTRVRVCMDDLTLDTITGKIIPKGCIDADANIEKNFRVEHALSFLNLWSAVAVLGIKLTHTAAQEAILDGMEDRELAATVDNMLLNNGEYIVQELKVEDERLSVFGKIDTRSELQ